MVKPLLCAAMLALIPCAMAGGGEASVLLSTASRQRTACAGYQGALDDSRAAPAASIRKALHRALYNDWGLYGFVQRLICRCPFGFESAGSPLPDTSGPLA
jgi:hypothetical protein